MVALTRRKQSLTSGPADAEDDVAPSSRALWTRDLTFGPVEIPVSLHAAVSHPDDNSFTRLDRPDLVPVGYERVHKWTGSPWPGTTSSGATHTPPMRTSSCETARAAHDATGPPRRRGRAASKEAAGSHFDRPARVTDPSHRSVAFPSSPESS